MTTIETTPRANIDQPEPAPDLEPAAAPETPTEPVATEEVPTIGGVPVSELLARLAASDTGRLPIEVDPEEVVFGHNIRTEASVDPDMVNSVRDKGFIQVPTAFINSDLKVQVVVGQRRIRAARDAGYNPCPVLLRSVPENLTAEQFEAELLADQWDENEQREDMTAAHKLGAIERALDLGVPMKRITKTLTGVHDADVRAVEALRKSKTARDTAALGTMTFDQAALLTEFDDDSDAVDQLTRAAARSGAEFTRTAAAIRTARRVEAARAEAAKPYQQRGFTILHRKPNQYDNNSFRPLEKLRTPTGDKLTEADIAPKHWGVYLAHTTRFVLSATGEPIDDDQIQHDPSAELEDGQHHAAEVTTQEFFTPGYYCLDKKAAGGLRYHEYDHRPFESATDKAAKNKRARQLNEFARRDTTARREFVTEWLCKEPNRDALRWRAQLEWSDPSIFTTHQATPIAAALLGGSASKLAQGIGFSRASIERFNMLMIGRGMGAVEARMQPDDDTPRYWRAAENKNVFGYTTDTSVFTPYLLLLRKLGHDLGPVDRYTIGEITAEQAIAEGIRNTPPKH